MAYSPIADAELQPNKPATSSLMIRLRDNPISILSAMGYPVTAKRTISAEYTPTANSLITFNHGLTVANAYEIDLHVYLVCKIAQHGYSINDVIHLNPGGDESSVGSSFSATLTTSQVLLRMGNAALEIRNKSTGTVASITVANWRLVLKARG